ncbi:MAG: PorP/SprF family type IX secretion system membrane protein [Bacteroidetes bacterium]|nr:PorP/SprF family type IX secretion system membrane protein [Bacteroidota bacterium]
MNRIIRFSTMVCFLFGQLISQAQDIHFSQFYENAILRNPALTGIFSGDYKAGINYRQQWSNISVPFQTVLASVESRVTVNSETGDNLSFGLTATYDKAGSISFNSFQIYPAINYNKALEDRHQSYLSVGFAAGYVQRSIDPSKMTFSNQYQNGMFNPYSNSNENITKTKAQYFDLGAGVSFNSSAGENNQLNYYVGAAAYHINKPKAGFSDNEAFLRMNLKWNGNLGVQYMIDEQYALTLHANYSRQGTYQETIAGALASWRSMDQRQRTNFVFYAGLFYRFNDAIISTVKLDYKNYSFTVSYDLNNSGLRTASNGMGGTEISIFSRGVLSKGPWAQDKNKCPRFESMILPAFR